MSILYVDSFDGYTSAEIPNFWIDRAISLSASIGTPARTGPGAMQPRPGGVARNIGTVLSSAIVGAAFQSNASGGPIFQFMKGGVLGSIQVSLNWAKNGTLYVGSAGGTITVALDTDLILPGIYQYVEWLTGFSHASLNQIRVNGHLVLSAVLDCQNTLTSGADTYFLLGPGGGNTSLFDDFYIVNPDDGSGLTTFAGDSQVICGIPSSDDAAGWSTHPVNPDHFQNVKEIPCDLNASYNFSVGSLSDDSYFVTPQLPLATDIIYTVQLTELIADQDGDGQQARPFIITPQGLYSNPALDVTVDSSYIPPQIVHGFAVNPKTGVSWTQPDANATSWGIAQA